jgi:hypothetical protein
MVLVKMKETAEAYLGHKVTHAVVTVPACKLCVLQYIRRRANVQTSTTLSEPLPRMPEPSPVSLFSESSTSLPPPPLVRTLCPRYEHH